MTVSKRAALLLEPGLEKHVQPVYDTPWGLPYAPIHSRIFEKQATSVYIPDKIIKAAQSLSPRQDGRYVHVNALGAREAWGGNKNGDDFPEWSLLHQPPPPEAMAFLKERGLAIPEEYGYETFETYGYPFLMHNNSHPDLSIGERVVCAGYNERMRRVELIIFVLTKKAPDLVSMIDRGEPIPWSMGCFPAGTPITMADGTTKPIEEIKVGDLVLTHTGAVKAVTGVHPRPYEGLLIDFSVEGGGEFSVTPEHPFWAASRDNALKNGRWIDEPKTDFLHAGCLKEGDYLTTPVMGEVLTPDYASPALAALLGYYLAEGHVLRNKAGEYAGVEFTANKDDVILSEIEDIAKAFGTRNPPIIRPRTNSEHAVRIDIFDSHLAELCYDHCGSYGRGKRLSEDVMQWHPDLQRHLLGKYLNGDGHQLTAWKKGAAIISTASDFLAAQIPHMLARVGIPATVNLIRHEAGNGFNESVTFEHQIYIGKQFVNILSEFSKIEPVECRGFGSGARLIDGQVFRRIKEVRERFFQGFVHNFEVEGDQSYVAAGYGVHNCRVPWDRCSICLNTAKNRAAYCEHLRSLMNVILPDGRKVTAENWFPRFFDISRVISPAWPAAWSLRKVAGVGVPVADPAAVIRHVSYQPDNVDFRKVASAQAAMRRTPSVHAFGSGTKVGEIEKEVPAEPGQDNLGSSILKPRVEKLLRNLVAKDADGSRIIPLVFLRKMKEELGPVDALRGATAAGILLKEPELNILSDGNENNVPESLDIEDVPSRLLDKFKDLIPSRSLFDPPFAKRVIRVIKISGPAEAAPGFGKEGSAVYKKYLGALRKLNAGHLLKAANRIDVLQARDPFALDKSLVGVTTEDDRYGPILPFVAGAGI